MKDLQSYTPARVQLGRAGDSLLTGTLLTLRLAHAKTRDAVQFPLDVTHLQAQMRWPSVVIQSAVKSREEYLRRPDLGRRLAPESVALLSSLPQPQSLAFVICDGLSALAVERHAVPLLDRVFKLLASEPVPVFMVSQGRVAIGDQIGELLQAEALVLLIGERPGLSSPDSLGVYLTWQPRSTRTDADRNCISNIHAAGLSYDAAAHKLVFLLREMFHRKLSGVALKDNSGGYLVTGWTAV